MVIVELNAMLKVIEESLDSVLQSVNSNSETLKNVSDLTKRISNMSNKNRKEENVKVTSDIHSW